MSPPRIEFGTRNIQVISAENTAFWFGILVTNAVMEYF